MGVGSPQQSSDPGLQLPDRERLGDVVVRPEVETQDAIGLLSPSREHENGDITALVTELTADLVATPLG